MQHLEGFQCVTAFDINMGYHNIKLSPTSQDMTTVVTEFGIFKYNCLPMGMCASGDIFHAKVDKLIGDIKSYIDYILVLSKEKISNCIEQPRIIFDRLRASGLKVNAIKCSFGLKDIP